MARRTCSAARPRPIAALAPERPFRSYGGSQAHGGLGGVSQRVARTRNASDGRVIGAWGASETVDDCEDARLGVGVGAVLDGAGGTDEERDQLGDAQIGPYFRWETAPTAGADSDVPPFRLEPLGPLQRNSNGVAGARCWAVSAARGTSDHPEAPDHRELPTPSTRERQAGTAREIVGRSGFCP
jgi:hypothetical protein